MAHLRIAHFLKKSRAPESFLLRVTHLNMAIQGGNMENNPDKLPKILALNLKAAEECKSKLAFDQVG